MERILVLGTGSGITMNCYSTCFLLQNDQECLLVDTGSGNQLLNNIKNVGINFNQIHNLFISHKHIDHLLGIFPFLRKICQEIRKNNYLGFLNIYCDKEIKQIVDTFIDSTFHEIHKKQYKEYIKYYLLENEQKLHIMNYDVEILDLYSKECIQYGFKTKLNNGQIISFLGDVPCSEKNYNKIKNTDWVLHEAMCLEKEEPIIKAREKNHSIVIDVAKNMQILNINNLVIWHTADNDITNRKKLYTNEAKKFFEGNVYVPNDMEEIKLS